MICEHSFNYNYIVQRAADWPIEPIFLQRWSSRAMNGEPLNQSHLLQLFEAARWAPSSGNSQPWHFIYALAKTEHFARLFSFLAEGNKAWCARAGALIVVASRLRSESGRELITHSFDTGAAFMSFALQGAAVGLVVHGMAGFDYELAKLEIELPEQYRVEAMIAVGYPGDVSELPSDLQTREKPSQRRPARLFVDEGFFGNVEASSKQD